MDIKKPLDNEDTRGLIYLGQFLNEIISFFFTQLD